MNDPPPHIPLLMLRGWAAFGAALAICGFLWLFLGMGAVKAMEFIWH
jgi:hypothetical protein